MAPKPATTSVAPAILARGRLGARPCVDALPIAQLRPKRSSGRSVFGAAWVGAFAAGRFGAALADEATEAVPRGAAAAALGDSDATGGASVTAGSARVSAGAGILSSIPGRGRC